MQVFILQVIEIYCLNIYLHCIVPYINSFNCPYFLTTVYLVFFFLISHQWTHLSCKNWKRQLRNREEIIANEIHWVKEKPCLRFILDLNSFNEHGSGWFNLPDILYSAL